MNIKIDDSQEINKPEDSIPVKVNHVSRATEKAKVLNRKAVKKPSKTVELEEPSKIEKKKSLNIGIELGLHPKIPTINAMAPESRAIRAKSTELSSLIGKFQSPKPKSISIRVESDLTVSHPEITVKKEKSRKPQTTDDNLGSEHREPAGAYEEMPILRDDEAPEADDSHLLEEVEISNPHERSSNPNKGKLKRALVGIFGVLFIASLGVGGSIGYSKLPEYTAKVAASKAGVQARLPILPDGFNLDREVSYEEGRVSFNFTDNKGKVGWIHQTATNISTETLRTTMIEPLKVVYSPLQIDGKTVFIYKNSEAAWINGPLLVVVEGETELDQAGITTIVKSL